MFSYGLTWCSLTALAIAAGCVARAAYAEFRWLGDPVASLFMGVAFPAVAASQSLALARLGWLARQQWPAAIGIFLAAVWVSVVTVYCWAAAAPSGPDTYEELAILRGLGLGAAWLPCFLGAVIVVAVKLLVAPGTSGQEAEPGRGT